MDRAGPALAVRITALLGRYPVLTLGIYRKYGSSQRTQGNQERGDSAGVARVCRLSRESNAGQRPSPGSNESSMTKGTWISVFVAVAAGMVGATGGATAASAQAAEITPGASGVSASTNDGNVPANAVDNKLSTRWSGSGDGAWLKLNLGAPQPVGHVAIAWYKGNARVATFDIEVSTDNTDWTPVLTGAKSGGTSTAEQIFDFADVTAQWVRYVGHGNDDPGSAQWNSVTEVSVFAPTAPTATPTPSTPPPTPTPTAEPTPTPIPTSTPVPPLYVELTPSAVTASTSDTNLAPNVVDNNLATRWSGNGDGAWLKVDLGSAKTVGYVKIAWWSGNTRVNTFDIQVSTDNVAWKDARLGAKSSGTGTAEETFDFDDVTARYVRYVGHGNSDPTKCCWNSVTEISIWGVNVVTPTPPPTNTPTPGPTPTVTPTPQAGETISLFDGTTLNGWIQVPANSWEVKNGAMASKGVGRGYIYTVGQYSHYRLMFTLRQVSGDHQPCVLIFGQYPPPSLDALGAIQFQPPNGGHWDYRPGHNNGGGSLFTRPNSTSFSRNQWARVEMLVNAATGRARMAVAQPVGTRAIENLRFNDITAGRRGPIAWQMHNRGIFDEFKDVTVEINPVVDDLLTIR